jgi:hypothetical protein
MSHQLKVIQNEIVVPRDVSESFKLISSGGEYLLIANVPVLALGPVCLHAISTW